MAASAMQDTHSAAMRCVLSNRQAVACTLPESRLFGSGLCGAVALHAEF